MYVPLVNYVPTKRSVHRIADVRSAHVYGGLCLYGGYRHTSRSDDLHQIILNYKICSVCVLLCLLDCSFRGAALSPPYLPRGWRPKGRAFELPTETSNKTTTTLELPEVLSEGSDLIREYGPPNLINTLKNEAQISSENITANFEFNIEISSDINNEDKTTERNNKNIDEVDYTTVNVEDSTYTEVTTAAFKLSSDNDEVTEREDNDTTTITQYESKISDVSEETDENNDKFESTTVISDKEITTTYKEKNISVQSLPNVVSGLKFRKENLENSSSVDSDYEEDVAKQINEFVLKNNANEVTGVESDEFYAVSNRSDSEINNYVEMQGKSAEDSYVPEGFKEYGPPPTTAPPSLKNLKGRSYLPDTSA